MNLSKVVAAALAALSTAATQAAPAARYRVTEIATPPAYTSGCIDGYARRASATGINDLGIASANFRCYTSVDDVNNLYTSNTHPFVAATHFGAYPLPELDGAYITDIVAINDRLQGFGSSSTSEGLFGVRWTVGGGVERVFTSPDASECLFNNNLNYASSGNGRGYIVGWAFRADRTLPPPLDTFCFTLGWVIRTPGGAQVDGPANGSPYDINAFDVAVGVVGNGAIKLHVPSGRQQVLDAGDATRAVIATDINDLGEAAGYSNTFEPEDVNRTCGPSTGLRWERDGRERPLRNLPGATSARTWAAGYDGETVGESGPGNYCDPDNGLQDQRAVIWRGIQATGLNSLIPASERITLLVAADVNRRGQIVATGYRNNEPQIACPDYRINPDTGFYEIDPANQCRNTYVYLLTPVGR